MNVKKRAGAIMAIAVASVLGAFVAAEERGLDVVARKVTGDPSFDAGRQYAVVIGIDKYKEWPSLKNAVSEAKSVKQALADRYVIDKFYELYNGEATAANIRRLFIETLPSQIGLKDSLLVFYAGHGQTDATSTGFWIASDGSKDQLLQNNWIPNQQLRNMIGSLKAQRILILADACFSGDFINVQRGASPTIDDAYYRQALRLTARQALTSGASQSVPDDSEFGRQLVDVLTRNDQALLDPVTMYEKIRRGVTKSLPLLGTMSGNQDGASFVLFLKSGGAETKASAVPMAAAGWGDLMVRADQEGAEVFVDGVSYGKAPVLVKKLGAVVNHTIVARSPTMSGSLDVTLAQGDVTEVSLKLEALTGNIYVSPAQGSDAGAGKTKLFVDGVEKGDLGSGIFKGIPVGAHRVELLGDDLYGAATILVSQGDTTQFGVVVRAVGTVSVEAPEGAPIVLTGSGWRMERTGGGTIERVPAGTVRLSAGGSGGWLLASHEQTLSKGDTIAWKPWNGGRIFFKGTEPSVIAFIDDASGIPARGVIDDIAQGEKKLIFKKPGFHDKEATVSVAVGKTTEVAVSLEKLMPATVSLDDFGIGLAIEAGPGIVYDAASKRWNVDAGVPIGLSLSSPFAERIEFAPKDSAFAEGGAYMLTVPNGRIELPWIPSGSEVRIGSAKAWMKLPNEANEGFRSKALPSGDYRLVVGMYSGKVTVPQDGIVEPADYRSVMIGSLAMNRQSIEQKIAGKRAKAKAGWISLATGIMGAAGAGAAYWLGDQAMSEYRGAATSAEAEEKYKSVQLYQTLFPIAVGIGGAGLGLSPILLGGTNPEALKHSIEQLDAGIAALRK